MSNPESLIGAPVRDDVTLKEIVHASCASFEASSPAFEAFWRNVGMYAGDFELEIYHASTSEGTFLDRCSVFCANRHQVHHGERPEYWSRPGLERIGWLEPEDAFEEGELLEDEGAEEPFDWTGQKIGQALWNLGHLERLCWDGKRMNASGAVPTAEEGDGMVTFMGSPGREALLARIFATLAWNHGPSDLDAIRKEALAALAKLPDPVHGVSHGRFAACIHEDVTRLYALCERDGTLAGGWLRDPQAEIKHTLTGRSNGNETRICLETDDEWFGVDFVTS